MLDMLEVIEPNSIDSIVTDPPYGLTSITKRFGKEDSAECKYGKDGSFARLSKGFMGKEWDGSGIEYNIETWQRCYEVLKPGGYLLAFGGSRTFHRIACAIEDAGFEIRDTIMWLYGSGFPKSIAIDKAIESKLLTGNANKTEFHKLNGEFEGKHNYGFAAMNKEQGIRPKDYSKEGASKFFLKELDATTELAKQYKGWGTALKPAYEPIIVARKPFSGACVDNVIKYGVGGINVDECRVGNETISIHNAPKGTFAGGEHGRGSDTSSYRDSTGRFPANVILTYDNTDFEEVCGGMPYTKSTGGSGEASIKNNFKNVKMGASGKAGANLGGLGDSSSASRYFYCAKASKKDRDEGLEEFEEKDANTTLNRKPRECRCILETKQSNL